MKNNSNELRIMTFNILVDKRNDTPYSWDCRKEQIIALIKYYNPDIFCLQEALEHQKIYISKCLPEYSCFGVGRNDGISDGEQVPIFHRTDMFKLNGEGYFWLSETPNIAGSIGWDAKCPRTVVWKELQHKASNSSLLVANTHYDHVGKTANFHSIELINKKLASIKTNCTTILCGDFNSSEETASYENALSVGFKDASKGEETICYGLPFTYHRFMMSQYIKDSAKLKKEHDRIFRAIDHIFYNGEINVLRYGVLADNVSGVYPSDHFPVICDFTI